MNLVILDPALHSLAGNNLEMDTALVDACASFGWTGHIFAHQRCNAHVANHPLVTPFFDIYRERTISDPALAEIDDFLMQGERLFADLVRLEDIVDLKTSVVFYACADPNTLTAIGRWSARIHRICRRLFLLFPLPFRYSAASDTATLEQLFYRYGFAEFRRQRVDPAQFLALSRDQATEYSKVARTDVAVAPYPVGRIEQSTPLTTYPLSKNIRILCSGASRTNKGFQLLPEIIRQIKASRSDIDFVVQYCPTDDLTVTANALIELGVTVIEGYFTRTEYHDLFESAHAVLLPYTGLAYRDGTSAVFSEARWFGRPVITTPATSMAADIALDPRLGIVAPAEVSALSKAISYLADNLTHLSKLAADAAVTYRSGNGTMHLAKLLVGSTASDRQARF